MNISSLLYLHRQTTASSDVKKDFDFLIELLREEGSKKKRWEIYLDANEKILEDGDLHSHSLLMEHLAYREATFEGLSEDQIILLMWAARFQNLHELTGNKNVHDNLQSEYAKEMLAKAVLISAKKNISNEEFDYAEFFDSIERRGHLNTALKLLESKHITGWNSLVADAFFEQLLPIIEHTKKYRSARFFLLKNSRKISHGLGNHFTREHVSKSSDIMPSRIKQIKKAWQDFLEKN